MQIRVGTKTNALEHYLERQFTTGDPSRIAFRTVEAELTYGELGEQVRRASYVLHTAGVNRGDRVLIALPDSLTFILFLLGAIGIGAVPTPISPQLSEEEHAFICADCQPHAAVVDGDQLERIARIRAEIGAPRVIFAAGDPPTQAEVIPIAAALAAAGRRSPTLVSPEEPALIQYTSGSTGQPKGVVHSHRGLLALPEGIGQRLGLTESDLCYSTAKLSFGYGLGNSVLLPLDAGGSTFLRAARSDPVGVLEAIQMARPTVVFAGPTLYGAIAAIPGAAEAFDLSSVRLYVSAGDALNASLFRRWRASFGREILDGLGSTECLHIFIAGHMAALRPGWVGEAIPPYEVRLTDESGNLVQLGDIGRLEVRGPANGVRYWNRELETEAAMAGGWIRTGDLLTQGENGSFRYVGRSDNVFKVRELKVAPVEIEEQLNAHPAVVESAVVGRTNPQGLTVICAFVQAVRDRHPGPALAGELRASLRASLSPHKLPQIFEFVDALPRTSTGKLARYRLRNGPFPPHER